MWNNDAHCSWFKRPLHEANNYYTHDMEDLIALRGDFSGFFYDDLCKTLKNIKMSLEI